MTTIRKGDLLIIKPEWRDPVSKLGFTYVAREDEAYGRVLISALELAHWTLWPTEMVRNDMVERTGARIEPEDVQS